MKGVVIAVVVVLAMIQLGQSHTCGQVDVSLAPCVPHLTQGGDPSPACCNGVKGIQGMALTTADKRAACHCVKAAANRYSNLKEDAAQVLPA